MSGTEFRISITSARVEGSVRRSGTNAFVDLPGSDLVIEHLKTVQVLEEWLKRWQLLRSLSERDQTSTRDQIVFVPETIDLLGSCLWKMALHNPIGNAIVEALDTPGPDPAAHPRVRISFRDALHMALLPWEFLQCPEVAGRKRFWLASETTLVLGRFVEGPDDLAITPADQQLRVLFVRAIPRGDRYQHQRDALDKLMKTLTDDVMRGRVHVAKVDDWNPDELQDAMQSFHSPEHPVDVVHLTALFRMLNDSCQVKLPSDNGRHEWAAAQTVVDNITAQHDNRPSLVVLHLIDPDEDLLQHSEQLAPEFIKGGVPAVLAMQYPMTTSEAHRFLTLFYKKLADGQPIGAAVQATRNRLKLGQPNRHFGSPVLYMQSDSDLHLINAPEALAVAVSPPTAPPIESQLAPLARPTADRGRGNVKARLLHVLDSVAPAGFDPTTIWDLRADVRKLSWPEDDAPARQLVLQLLREKQDQADRALLCERLLAELTGMARGLS